jgi:phage gp29-like protein
VPGLSRKSGRSTALATRAPQKQIEFVFDDTDPLIEEQSLWRQFRRIGGNLTPQQVSQLIVQADAGDICDFVNLANEARQKDGHLHSVLQTRELAIKGLRWSILPPRDPSAAEKKAAAEIQGVLEDSENFPDLLHHLTGSGVYHGHATAETMYKWTTLGKKSKLIPYRWNPVHPNRFAFSQADGKLLFTEDGVTGIDLLEAYPGKFIQYQPIVNGDAKVREGLARLLIWLALFRNWDLRDWLQFGEIAWKPWRTGKYQKDANKQDIEILKRALQKLGTTGSAVFPETVDLNIEWPKGVGSTVTSSHKELFDVMGAEMSKATLGQTLTVEQGNRGSQSLGNVQDRVRGDIKVGDAVSEAAVLTRLAIKPYYALNYAERIRPGRLIFHTEDAVDLVSFSKAVKTLVEAGLEIPAEWVRNQGGIPNPEKGEDVLVMGGKKESSNDNQGTDDGENPNEDDEAA